MKAVKVLGLAVIFGLMATGITLADGLKIAYVDLGKVFDGYTKTKEFDSVLQSEGDAYQKQRDSMIQKIQDDQNKMDLMKDTERAAMQVDVDKEKGDVIAFDKQKREELGKKRDDKLREILGEIQAVASDLSKKEGYDYILNDRVMVYGDSKYDVTGVVLKTLNDNYKR